jgi:hypothetical protein
MKKVLSTLAIVATLVGTCTVTTTSADAQRWGWRGGGLGWRGGVGWRGGLGWGGVGWRGAGWRGAGWRPGWGWGGAALGVGAALGFAAAASPYYGYGNGYAPYTGLYSYSPLYSTGGCTCQ